jgi:hypothetical protein
LARRPLPPRDPLAFVFAQMWEAFIESSELDAYNLEKIIERSGLATWRTATEADVKRAQYDLEVGDPILCLTDEGMLVLARGIDR